jgi:hypothetical protein
MVNFLLIFIDAEVKVKVNGNLLEDLNGIPGIANK